MNSFQNILITASIEGKEQEIKKIIRNSMNT